jgi:hypothetical protein
MIITFSQCNGRILFSVEASATTAASSRLPVIVLHKLNQILFAKSGKARTIYVLHKNNREQINIFVD